MKESDILGVAGIVAEYNPFHNGHKYLIDCAKRDGHTVCSVISGNFVQRGDVSIISKFDRTRQALLCGVDVVCELPTPWAMSTAQNFALGAISQLSALGADILYFGSECGDTEKLVRAASILSSLAISDLIKSELNSGKTYATIRQEALSKIDSSLADLLNGANDNLAIEYISAASALNLKLKFKAIRRIGAKHGDIEEVGMYSTATLIRERINKQDTTALYKFIPNTAIDVLLNAETANICYLETAILSQLRGMTINDFKCLPDISEGLENKLYNSIQVATSLDELYTLLKTKRYTLARIRRLVLSAYLGIDSYYFKKEPPYVRILGFRGQALSTLKNTNKPIITRVSQIDSLDDFSRSVFKCECQTTDKYSLAFKVPKKCGAELTTPLIKI